MIRTVKDIIKFVVSWNEKYGVLIEDEQIADFVGELQKQISEMDFSVPDGTTTILYTGYSNGIETWKIAREMSESMGDSARETLINSSIFR